jgi:thymidylate synthase
LGDLLQWGDEVGSRNGRVKEFLNAQIVLTDPTRREILNPNRKVNVFAQIAETCWVLAGRNDIEWLSAYLPRAVDYSDDGKVWRGGYGPRLRGGYFGFDQLEHVVDLLKADPLSRRAVIAIYEPTVDASPGKDIPCNDFLQFQSRLGKLHLTVTVRSNDVMWGWSGINAFEWSVVQEIVASLLGIEVGPLTFNIGSLHLYEYHWEKADNIGEQILDEPPTRFNPDRTITTLGEVDSLLERWFWWEGLCRHGQATMDLLYEWEEPLFRAWAAAIAYYWTRGDLWLQVFQGTALGVAVAQTPFSVYPAASESPRSVPVALPPTATLSETVVAFYAFVSELHAVKHKSYGDSWKKRGEQLSILANIARKVDRLGVGDEFDSAADTWIDLMVYLAKYICWISGVDDGPVGVNTLLRWAIDDTDEKMVLGVDLKDYILDITYSFDGYADNVETKDVDEKREFVKDLLLRVTPVAREMWVYEQSDEYRGADVD